MDDQQGTIAIGVAFLAVLGAIWGAVEVLGAFDTDVPPELVDTCEAPIEVMEAGLTRLGCVGEPALSGCLGLARGDRAELHGAGECRVSAGAMAARMKLQAGVLLDLNTVSAEELTLIRGIGPKLSEAIVSHRTKFGSFGSVAELERVHGIGDATVAQLRTVVAVNAGNLRGGHDEMPEQKEAQ